MEASEEEAKVESEINESTNSTQGNLMKGNQETESQLMQAFDETNEMRFERDGQRWGAVTYALFHKTGKMVSARTARGRVTKIKEREEARERYERQGIKSPQLELGSLEDARSLSVQLGAVYSEIVALREDMRAASREMNALVKEMSNA